MTLLAGAALLLLGLLAMLVAVHFKGLRYFDRPTPARNAYFDPILDLLKWTLVVAGLLLLLRASRPAVVVAGAALLALWSYRRFVRSGYFQERLLRRDFIALRKSRPDMSDEEILFELAYRKHPRWGPELIEQMAKDYPTVESFARMLGRMERGFRGFRGRRPASPRRG
ncbi:MAG: hypothetical protein DMF52_09160 [Acidobacteria bacterium]|nr:MAG: hypothetical protein DMF52_09160 [Acidobacteriota bacterium]